MVSRLLIISLLLASALRGAAQEEPKPDVYLLIGQSNMAGRAPLGEKEDEALERCLLLNSDSLWEPARNPLNRYSTIRKGLGMQQVGLGYSFAKRMLASDEGLTLGLVVNARGGSSILEWKKGATYYEDAVRRALVAKKSGVLRGILWHQGESDQSDIAYLGKLKTLINNLRGDLGDEKLPFVAGQVHKVDLINRQIAQLPKEVPHTAFASSKGLTCMDRWHFDARSMQLLGERYADAMMGLQGQGAVNGEE